MFLGIDLITSKGFACNEWQYMTLLTEGSDCGVWNSLVCQSAIARGLFRWETGVWRQIKINHAQMQALWFSGWVFSVPFVHKLRNIYPQYNKRHQRSGLFIFLLISMARHRSCFPPLVVLYTFYVLNHFHKDVGKIFLFPHSCLPFFWGLLKFHLCWQCFWILLVELCRFFFVMYKQLAHLNRFTIWSPQMTWCTSLCTSTPKHTTGIRFMACLTALANRALCVCSSVMSSTGFMRGLQQ